MAPSDDELIRAVLHGDTASFELLIQKYQPSVFATAWESVPGQVSGASSTSRTPSAKARD